jgi:hypothetical protein
MVECYKCLRPLPRAASSPQKVKRKVYTGSSSRGLLFSESSVLNIILRRLVGRRTPHRSYTAMRVICLDCDAKIRRSRIVVPLVIVGVTLSLFAFIRYEVSSGNSYALIDRGSRWPKPVLVGRAIMQCLQSLAAVDGFDKGADGASSQIAIATRRST